MNNDEWFEILNLEEFINQTRAMVFNKYGQPNGPTSDDDIDSLMNLSQSQRQELDDVLPYDECFSIALSLVRKQHHKITKETRYILTEPLFVQFIYQLSDRITSNILQSLVKKGLVETGYDSEANDFLFWIKKDDENKKEN